MTSSTWTLSWAGATHQGNVRAQNQDNFFVDPEGRYLILADGMGGHSGGEVASERTVEAVRNHLEKLDWSDLPSTQEIAKMCTRAAVESLKSWVSEHADQEDLGTTLIVWVRHKDKIGIFSLGDSRVYLLRNEGLFQLTCDQIIETELRKRGATRQQAARSPGAAYLSRCILATRECEPDVLEVEIRPGDIWVLCSDGLSREVKNIEIRDMILAAEGAGVDTYVTQLIEKALEHGGRDNVTVIACKFHDETATAS